MEFTTYIRKPFEVQAVKVTAENIAEVADFVGDLKQKDDGTPYILVDRRIVPNVPKVYIGFYMTKMGDNIRVYSRRIFDDSFVVADENVQQWLAYLNGQSGEAEAPAEAS